MVLDRILHKQEAAVAKHKHDGYPLHPVAVKHHTEYFSNVDAREGAPIKQVPENYPLAGTQNAWNAAKQAKELAAKAFQQYDDKVYAMIQRNETIPDTVKRTREKLMDARDRAARQLESVRRKALVGEYERKPSSSNSPRRDVSAVEVLKQPWEITQREMSRSYRQAFHGTPVAFDRLNLPESGFLFFTSSKEYARQYAEKNGGGGRILTYFLNMTNTLEIEDINFSKHTTLRELVSDLEEYGDDEVADDVKEQWREWAEDDYEFNPWEIINTKEFRGILVKHGFDSVRATEGETDIWIIVSPDQAIDHKHVIWQALSEGKPVPPEVLADYPDLKSKAGIIRPPVDTAAKDGAVSKTEMSYQDFLQSTNRGEYVPDAVAEPHLASASTGVYAKWRQNKLNALRAKSPTILTTDEREFLDVWELLSPSVKSLKKWVSENK